MEIMLDFTDEVQQFLNQYAKENNTDVTDVIKNFIAERIEDELDSKEIAQRLMEVDTEKFTFDELIEMTDLAHEV